MAPTNQSYLEGFLVQSTGRDHSVKNLLEVLKKTVSFTTGLVFTVAPRGGLQLAQPANVSEGLLKAYGKSFYNEDRLSWTAILKKKATRVSDIYGRDELERSLYSQELLQPQNLKYGVALPIAAPVIQGYPGVVHVLRTAAEGDFSGKEIEALNGVIAQFDARKAPAAKKGAKAAPAVSSAFIILDGKQKPIYNAPGFASLDQRIREQLVDHAKRRQQVNGSGSVADRVTVPDSHGDVWVFRVVAYRRFPGLGDGPYTFLCRQPACHDWVAVKPTDFAADSELSRLIPSLKFMQQEFHRGPTLVEVSKQVHLSPFHFHRRFTELMGLTPKQFLLDCQILEAKHELVAGQKELAQIAKDCGFAHQSHFTSRFKQTTGLTPTRWRRMMADRSESR